VELLLTHKANVSATDEVAMAIPAILFIRFIIFKFDLPHFLYYFVFMKWGLTPLHLAAVGGHREVTGTLLTHKAGVATVSKVKREGRCANFYINKLQLLYLQLYFLP